MEKRTLLIPLDTTPFSRQVLAQVQHLFPPANVTVALLHVRVEGESDSKAAPRYSYGHPGTSASQHTFDKEGLDATDRALAAALERDAALFREAGYDASAQLHHGNPVDVIVDVAEREGVDAIAMTTHGRTGLGQLLLGSVAQAVVARAAVPVLLLRGETSAGD